MGCANCAAMMCGTSARVIIANRTRNRRRYFASAILRVFLISQEPDILQALLVCNDAVAACPHRAMDKHRYDVATRLLWLEAGFLPLAVGFTQHGIPALRRCSHQYLYVEGNSHEPERIRLGLYNSEFFRWHFFHFGRGVHCSLGRSADICDWLGAASCWCPLALSLRFASVALLVGIRCTHSDRD